MEDDFFSRLPRSFQIWQHIEEEANRRAEARLQEMKKGQCATTRRTTPENIILNLPKEA